MREEILILCLIRAEIKEAQRNTWRTWKGGKVPNSIQQRMESLKEMMSYLNNRIDTLTIESMGKNDNLPR